MSMDNDMDMDTDKDLVYTDTDTDTDILETKIVCIGYPIILTLRSSIRRDQLPIQE
jgi:hypothetical protein